MIEKKVEEIQVVGEDVREALIERTVSLPTIVNKKNRKRKALPQQERGMTQWQQVAEERNVLHSPR